MSATFTTGPESGVPMALGNSRPCPEITMDDLDVSSHELSSRASRARHSRRQPEGHIPRPPNAFILFRSSFIRSQRVSPDVETNHSTLSKIIGLTWQNLPAEERRVWYAKARQAVEQHRRRFPESLSCSGRGKHGRALEADMHEFDRRRVPSVVTRFEPPITSNEYRRAFSAPAPDTESYLSSTPIIAQRRRSSSSGPSSRSRESPADGVNDQPVGLESTVDTFISPLPTELGTKHWDFSEFSFGSALPGVSPAFTCDPLWFGGTPDPVWNNSNGFPTDEFSKFTANQVPESEYTSALNINAPIVESAMQPQPTQSTHCSTHASFPGTPYAGAPAYVQEIDPYIAHSQPELSQIEADFANLMAQYSFEA
ncbi:Repressor ROX1 [Mycena venus]|uniref:Repressor ROX1 n=1 Tax=Mycena venus TaxID=2733690 RepID=A0A8H7D1H8_9AGAR|nr:Repressor ROX1 [Mycena venus]